jgi:hypothetical protein
LNITHPVTANDGYHTLNDYTKSQFKVDWAVDSIPSSSGEPSGRLTVVSNPSKPEEKVFGLTYLAGEVGGSSAMTFDAPLQGKFDRLSFEYRWRFDDNFTFVKGGKMPGLTSSPYSPTGCIENNTFDGFSVRYMWREDGRLYIYVYNPDKQAECGDYYETDIPIYFVQGRWYTLTQEIFIGDPNIANGSIDVWVNGEHVASIRNIKLRKSSSIAIDMVKMDSFFGGSDPSTWAPSTDQHTTFTNFTIFTPPTLHKQRKPPSDFPYQKTLPIQEKKPVPSDDSLQVARTLLRGSSPNFHPTNFLLFQNLYPMFKKMLLTNGKTLIQSTAIPSMVKSSLRGRATHPSPSKNSHPMLRKAAPAQKNESVQAADTSTTKRSLRGRATHPSPSKNLHPMLRKASSAQKKESVQAADTSTTKRSLRGRATHPSSSKNSHPMLRKAAPAQKNESVQAADTSTTKRSLRGRATHPSPSKNPHPMLRKAPAGVI